VVEGQVTVDGMGFREGQMVVFREGAPAKVLASGEARVLLLGGAPLDGPRFIWWNFVSSSRERIERAKEAWRNRAMGVIPGDSTEYIPLPES
jgi:redox-sensitive bicupin YhaK (pirin superfamily)